MPSCEGWAARDRAARPVLERIAADADGAPLAIGRMLRHVQEHLFDPALTVASMVRACGYQSRATADAFPRAVGTTAKAYITEQRLTVAHRLLSATSLKVADVGRLVGVKDATTFSRSVRRRFGASPKALRRRAEDEPREDVLQAIDDASSQPWIDLLTEWHRLEAHSSLEETSFDQESSARLRAETAWALARPLASSARKTLIVRAALVNPFLAEYLASNSRIEGRGNRAHGVSMAALAVESVPAAPNDAWSAEDIASAQVSCRVWHANALRLALDYPAADAVLARAQAILEASACAIPVDVEIRLHEIHASLFLDWSKTELAMNCSTRALELATSHGDPGTLARVLLGRAGIHGFVDDFQAAVETLSRAQVLVDEAPSAADLAYGVASATCLYLHSAGNLDLARRALSRTKILASAIPDPLARAYARAMEGRLLLDSQSYARAATLLTDACAVFVDREAYFLHVLFGLDLCLAWLRAGEPLKALERARVLVPLMGALTLDRELTAVARVIEEGVRRGVLRRRTVQAARRAMDQASRRPGLKARLAADWATAQ